MVRWVFVFAVFMPGAQASPGGALGHDLHRTMTATAERMALSWKPVPEAAHGMIDYLLKSMSPKPEVFAAMIRQERRVCTAGPRLFCWDPIAASRDEKMALTEMTCRILRLRQEEEMKNLREAFEPDGNGEWPHAYRERSVRLSRFVHESLEGGGVGRGPIETSIREKLKSPFPDGQWPLEATAAFDRVRTSLARFPSHRFPTTFAYVGNQLRQFVRAGGFLPDSANEATYVHIAAEKNGGLPNLLQDLQADLRDQLETALPGTGALKVSLWVHRREPVSPHVDVDRYERGLPQPYRLDLDNLDPSLEVEFDDGRIVRFRMVFETLPSGQKSWRFVPESFTLSPREQGDIAQTITPFSELEDRQLACLAGFGSALAQPAPPSAPVTLPPLARLKSWPVQVALIRATREPGNPSGPIRSRVGVLSILNPSGSSTPAQDMGLDTFLRFRTQVEDPRDRDKAPR